MISLEDQQVPEPVLVGSRRGGLEVYGPGTDGDVIIVSAVSLTRDMYYNNLTLTSGAQLDTNGYKVFVKDTLYLADSNCLVGRLADNTNTGTIMGGAGSGVKASDTLGGDGGYNVGENFFGEAEFYNFSTAIAAYKFDAIRNELRFLMGGSGGQEGEDGADGAAGDAGTASPGLPGSAGAPGNRPGFENTVGEPGGRGFTGATGAPGNVGTGGAGGPKGIRGFGGTGGGVVIISARNIIGTGIVRADGFAPTPPTPGQPGFPGTPGNQGEPGLVGDDAPDFFAQSYTYVVNYAYNQPFTNTATNNPYPYTTYNTPQTIPESNPGTPYIASYYSEITYSAPKRGFYPTTQYFSYNVPGNPFPTRGGNVYYIARTNYGFNPGQRVARTTQGPRNVRFRTTFTFVPGNPFSRTTYSAAYNPLNYGTNPSNPASQTFTYYTAYVYNDKIVNNVAQTTFNEPYPFNRFVAGNPFTTYNPGTTFTQSGSTFVPQVNAFEPSIYHTGGAGGLGGDGGEGAIASAGLPGSPGTPGYAGGGGVVMIITESDIPQEIDVRAAAGTGDGGFATAGTVIIIKNEEEVV